jgi:inosine-uridine nucleoside N-ribohydrolase
VATPIILDCDPGHDDALALMLAVSSPEVELVGVTTVHGNQTLDKTTVNALKVLELVGRADVPVARGADRPLSRDLAVADHVHGETGWTDRRCRRRPHGRSTRMPSPSSRVTCGPTSCSSRPAR